MSETILDVARLYKYFGPVETPFVAVNSISFSLKKGQILGLLGPNGAGKTTTLQMLTSVTRPDGGTITYFDKDFTAHREWCLARVNFASAYSTLVGRITVKENLLVFAYIYNVRDAAKKIETLADYFDISHLLNQLYEGLSAGQKTRISLVKALLNDPEILLLDEPTASLDPDIADKTMELIETLNRERGISILYTSHNMDEITRLCDEVIFLDRGNIVAQDTPRNLTKRITHSTVSLEFEGDTAKIRGYLVDHALTHSFSSEGEVIIHTEESSIPDMLFAIQKMKIRIMNIDIQKPTLEDVFLDIARGGNA